MIDEPSHYEILQVEPDADLQAIKQAYRQQMRLYHPDRFVGERAQLEREGLLSDDEEIDEKIDLARQMTQKINAAYAVLSDSQQREHYDRMLYATQIEKSLESHFRPHRRPHRVKSDKAQSFPFALFIVLLLFLLAIFAWLSDLLAVG